jgi:hypothetical protein
MPLSFRKDRPMSHTPPVPEAAIAPFPLHPAPQPHHTAPAPAPKPGDDRTRLIAGAAVGIGSAAIVAALLYANRKPGKAPRDAGRHPRPM